MPKRAVTLSNFVYIPDRILVHIRQPGLCEKHTNTLALPHKQKQDQIICKKDSPKGAGDDGSVAALKNPGKKLKTIFNQ